MVARKNPVRTLSLGKRGDDLLGLLFRFGGLTSSQYAQVMERPTQEDAEKGRRVKLVGMEIRTQAEGLISDGRVRLVEPGVVEVTDDAGRTITVVDGECPCPVRGSCAHRAAAALVLSDPLRAGRTDSVQEVELG